MHSIELLQNNGYTLFITREKDRKHTSVANVFHSLLIYFLFYFKCETVTQCRSKRGNIESIYSHRIPSILSVLVHIHIYFRTMKTTNIQGEQIKRSLLICRICGDVARGMNFDVMTCISCKAFFRRNALRPVVSVDFYFIKLF